jgi:hypothetical protein
MTCAVHNCEDPRVPRSSWCISHRANDLRNGSVWIAARTPTSGPEYGCLVCGGSMPPGRVIDGTCSTSCAYRRALSSGPPR